MSDILNGFELLGEFTSENAGFCRWTFARKKGKEYFLKEFVDPVYPQDMSLSPAIIEDRRNICSQFESAKTHLYESVNEISDGNLIRVEEFFRCGSRYYIAMPRVPEAGVTIEEISSSPLEAKVQLCRTIAHSMMRLHDRGIVHADIKPNNVLIKRTDTGRFTARIIDYDCSFFQMNPPKAEEDLHGDQVYLSPEALRFFVGEHVLLTCEMDVFALGIMFHEYLTGEIPGFNTEEYDYPCEALLEGDRLILSDKLDSMGNLKEILSRMLTVDPARRIPIHKVFELLGGETEVSPAWAGSMEGTKKDGSDNRDKRNGPGGFRPAGMTDLC